MRDFEEKQIHNKYSLLFLLPIQTAIRIQQCCCCVRIHDRSCPSEALMKFFLSVGRLCSARAQEGAGSAWWSPQVSGKMLEVYKDRSWKQQQQSTVWLLFAKSTSICNQYRKRGTPALIKWLKKAPKFLKGSFSFSWWAHTPDLEGRRCCRQQKLSLSEINEGITASSTSCAKLQPGSWCNLPCQLHHTVEKYFCSQPGARSHPDSYCYGRCCSEWGKNTENNS